MKLVAALTVFVLLIVGAAILTGTDSASTASHSSHEQVKVFWQGVGNEAGMQKLEDTLNAWLKENADRVRITGRTQSGQQFSTVVIIWYTKH